MFKHAGFLRVLFLRLFSSLTFVCLSISVSFADVDEGLKLLQAGQVKEAAEVFAKAYEAGNGDGAFYLGRLMELGLGAERDEMRAANLYSAGAEKGSTLAQTRLGLMYHEGRVLLRDYTEGTKLLCQAADSGDANGQLNCGLAYQAGRGVGVDMAKAVSYWQKAAEQDNVAALNVLGQYYFDADEVDKAKQYFKEAAEQGNAVGMFEYAKLLNAGETPDRVGAYAYSSLAVVRGLREAGAFRDQLEADMSADEVSEGQKQAREWTEARIAEADKTIP